MRDGEIDVGLTLVDRLPSGLQWEPLLTLKLGLLADGDRTRICEDSDSPARVQMNPKEREKHDAHANLARTEPQQFN